MSKRAVRAALFVIDRYLPLIGAETILPWQMPCAAVCAGAGGAGGAKLARLNESKRLMESSVSTTEYTGFDILGRVTAHKQTTDGIDYTTGYAYNLSGALIEETYPSGRVVKNTLDADGGLALVQSKKTSSDFYRPYASNLVYNAARRGRCGLGMGSGRTRCSIPVCSRRRSGWGTV
ncbi:MAG: hypothetical protein KIT61_05580 [Pyrinomonadaceae bacterium]|nr:hypothetical protein [Pyrinomonadaceae bacterium]